MSWADSHCHLPAAAEESAALVADARAADVSLLVAIGTDAGETRAAIANARAHDRVWATAGLHPHDAQQGVDTLVPLLAEPEVVAVGECGLDYHYDHSPRDVQRAVFAAQIGLAHERGLALVIHTREAWDDTFAILTAEGVPERTVFHCFTGGADEARRALDVGAHLSFSGIVTFKGANDPRAAAAPSARSTACSSRPTRRSSRPFRIAASRTAPRSCRSSARRWRQHGGSTSPTSRRRPGPTPNGSST